MILPGTATVVAAASASISACTECGQRDGSSDVPAVCGDRLPVSGHLDMLGSSASSKWVCTGSKAAILV